MGRGEGDSRVEGSVNQEAKESRPERLQKLGSIMLLNIARNVFCRLIQWSEMKRHWTILEEQAGFRTWSEVYGQYSDAENY